MSETRVDLKTENEQLKSTLSYFMVAEVIAGIVLILVLFYLFRNRASWHKKQQLQGQLDAARQQNDTCGVLPHGLMIPSQGCAKGTPWSCKAPPMRAFLQSSKYDIYKRNNSEQTSCMTAPTHGYHYAPGQGPVCNAEARLFKALDRN